MKQKPGGEGPPPAAESKLQSRDKIFSREPRNSASASSQQLEAEEDWDRDRVSVTEAEELRGAVFHTHYYLTASRLYHAILEETPLHRSRGTVVAGHGSAGAIGLVLACLLNNVGYEIRNVVSFGAPKAIEQILERTVSFINPVRVALSTDPAVEVPVLSTSGILFKHVGEALVLLPEESKTFNEKKAADSEESTGDVDKKPGSQNAGTSQAEYEDKYNIHRYLTLMKDPSIELQYHEADPGQWDEGSLSQTLKESEMDALMGRSINQKAVGRR
jgi:hypothetical protein